MSDGNVIFHLLHILAFELDLSIGFNVVDVVTSNCGGLSRTAMVQQSMSLHRYGFKFGNKSSFSFAVKAARDAAIYATDTQDSQNALSFYNLYIGSNNNTMTEMTDFRNGQMSWRGDIPGSDLDASLYKSFWFSWEDGNIKAGQGDTEGDNVLMSWTDSNPFHVNGIGIGTCWDATGEWKIMMEVEDHFAGHFKKCHTVLDGSRQYIIATDVASVVSCAATCGTTDDCFGFFHQLTTNRCELLTFGDGPVTSTIRSDIDGWYYFAKCFDKFSDCVGCNL